MANRRRFIVLLVLATGSLLALLRPVALLADQQGRPRRVSFSGYDWWVKSSDTPVGPGPNLFSDSPKSVWVDRRGKLHLRIRRDGKLWRCAEVVSERSFGYGTYRFQVESDVAALDPNAVLGLFTWSDAPKFHHREIDIEFSRWGDPGNKNAQFVVQPWTEPENLVRFSLPRGLRGTTHQFAWSRDRVAFRSASAKTLIHAQEISTAVPEAGGENARINLWLIGGDAPRENRDIEVVVSGFEFIPPQKYLVTDETSQGKPLGDD